jgi:hypothetical protein
LLNKGFSVAGGESPPLRHSCSKPSVHLKSRLHIGFMPPEWYTPVVHMILAKARYRDVAQEIEDHWLTLEQAASAQPIVTLTQK